MNQIIPRPYEDKEIIEKQSKNIYTHLDPSYVLKKADELLLNPKEGGPTSDPSDLVFKALTLNEFNKGSLLSCSVSEHYKTFGINLMRELQEEYRCTTTSEKATAELAAVSFIRTLDLQRRLTNYLEIGKFTDIGVGYLSVLSKDLDRANRHYLTAIQTLRLLKQPVLQVNIRTDTAIVGQNQIVQNNEPK